MQVGALGGGKVLGDALFLVRNLEYLVQSRFADVQSDQYDFLAQQGKADGEVGGDERFSFAAHGRGDKDDFLLGISHHEEQAGT